MNTKDLKKVFIATGIVAIVPTIYFIVEMIVNLTSEKVMPKIWSTLNWVAIALYGVCLLGLVAVIVFTLLSEKKQANKALKEVENQESLKKYQTKKK